MSHVALLIVKERFRGTLRRVLFCMALVGVSAALLLQSNQYQGWTRPVFIALLFGVPGGLILYPAYRMLRFAAGR